MIRQAWLVIYLTTAGLAFASDPESGRVDALIQDQDKSKSRKLPPAQSFVLGNTELRVDEKNDSSDAPVIRPAPDSSAAIVTLRQPLHENASLNLTNEFGSHKSDSLPFSQAEGTTTISRKDIWSLDWARSGWNAKVYAENQSAGSSEQQLLSAQQTAQGIQTGTNFSSGTGVSVEARMENNLLVSSGASERNIYQTQVSQKLGSLPFTLEFTPGLEKETDANGENVSHSTRFNNALRWQATPQTRVVLGTGINSKDYFNASREEAMLYYSQVDTVVQKDLTFSLRSDFQDLTRNDGFSSPYQEQKMSFQIGPRLRLPENFTAALDMRYGYTQQNGSEGSSGTGQAEQAVALSIQGKF